MPLLGAHMSVAGGLYRSLLRGKEAGCQVIQIFSRNRSRWTCPRLSTEEIDRFLKTRSETSIEPVAVHTSYLINLASPRPEVFEKSSVALKEELDRAEQLMIPFLVIHPGAHLGRGEKRGIKQITEAIKNVAGRSQNNRVTILFEMTAGQGTNLGYRLEQLAELIEGTESEVRVGVCFDSCHAFAAGYDFTSEDDYNRLFRRFDRVIGLSRLKLFHLNDSKGRLGSRLDRHEHPGQGFIGLEPFSLLLNDPRFTGLPFLLETPKGKNEEGLDLDIANLGLLKTLIKSDIINKRRENDCI